MQDAGIQNISFDLFLITPACSFLVGVISVLKSFNTKNSYITSQHKNNNSMITNGLISKNIIDG